MLDDARAHTQKLKRMFFAAKPIRCNSVAVAERYQKVYRVIDVRGRHRGWAVSVLLEMVTVVVVVTVVVFIDFFLHFFFVFSASAVQSVVVRARSRAHALFLASC